MSSSFTDQPPPYRPHEEGYTPTPPPLERGHREFDDRDADIPRLGSLAQKARSKQLRSARRILFAIGILTVLINGAFLFMIPHFVDEMINKEVTKAGGMAQVDPVQVEKVRNELLTLNYGLTLMFFITGVVFLVCGSLVYRFPLAMTVTSLVIYLLATVAGIVIAVAGDEPAAAGSGMIIKIIIIVALAKSIQSAHAYEKERRAEEEYGMSW